MRECYVLNDANEKESELYPKLVKALGSEDLAFDLYERLVDRKGDFIEIFGDWATDYKLEPEKRSPSIRDRTMSNGEPELKRKPGTNQYYFTDKEGAPYFLNLQRFAELSSEEIDEVTRTLLHGYVTQQGSKSMNEVNPEELQDKDIISSIERTMEDYKEKVEALDNEELKEILIARADLVLKYKQDFFMEIKNAMSALGKELKQTITDAEGNVLTEIPLDERAEGLNIQDKFLTNSKDTATANTKILLSQIEETMNVEDEDGNISIQAVGGDFLGLPKFAEFNEVWSTLQPLLSDIVGFGHGQTVTNVYDLMLEEIRILDDNGIKPWARDLIEKLENLNIDKRTEFLQAFSLTKLNFYVTEFDGKNYKVINATSTTSRESQIVNAWGYMFQTNFLDGVRVSAEGRTKLSNILQTTNTLFNTYNEALANANKNQDPQAKEDATDQAIYDAAISLLDVWDSMGVFDVKDDDIDTFFAYNGGIDERLRELKRMFRSTKLLLEDALKEGRVFSDGQEYVNPFSNEATMFKGLAWATGMRNTDIGESSILGNKGKTYYAYSSPTYVSNKINEWRQDVKSKMDSAGGTTALEDYWASHIGNTNSRWLQYLAGIDDPTNPGSVIERRKKSYDRLTKFQIGLSSSFKSKGKNDGSDNKEINFADAINDNITKLLGGHLGGGKSYFPTIVPADKSRRMELTGLDPILSGIDVDENGQVFIPDTVLNIFVKYFEDEYNRMKRVKRENAEFDDSKKIVHYHAKGDELGNGSRSQLFPDFSFDSKNPDYVELRDALYSSDGTPHTDDKLTGLGDSQIKLLKEAIEKDLQRKVQETMEELESIDNINKDLTKFYDMGAFDGKVALAGDYLVNGLVSTIEYGKVFSGDPAFYKNVNDLIKRVPATYTDGLQLMIRPKDNVNFNQATVDGVEVASSYVDKIIESVEDKSIAEDYKKVNTTDAQAWITPNRWKFLMQRLGKWGPLHKKAFNRMMNGERLYGDMLKVVAQPLKGVYFEINNGRPVYLKYSQAVLVPNLVKGTPMEKMLEKMTTDAEGNPLDPRDEIHEVITIDGVKVGAMFPTKVHEAGTTKMADNFELNAVQLSNRGWKLQQDLPIKKMKQTNVGSQIQKNILAGMVMDGDYTFQGETIKGRELMQKIHDTVSALSDLGKEKLSEEFGIEDGKITSKDRLYAALIDEFKKRGGNDNIIAALEKEMPFDAIPQIADKVQSIFLSMVNKEITKISTMGGSFIQVSPFGLETVGKDSGIKIISKNYDGKGLQPPRKVDGKVLPGQAFIPHSEIARILWENGNHDINNMTSEEIMALLTPEALELVTYRIPNQGMSSNDALEIVGILPPGMGDSIIAYDGIPAKTGSDFDIDKMYVMMKNLVFDKDQGKIVAATEGTKGIQNQLVDLYKAVLTSPLTYDAMMRSIDGAFLKDDIAGNPKKGIKGLFEAEKRGNLDMFSPITQMKTKFEYLSGKFGVAQTANQLVDHVLNQQLNIGLETYLGIGNYEMVGDKRMTVFDKENSDNPQDIATILSAFLNAYVDIAKDPYIARGNHNGVTANTAFMLTRAGVPVEWTNRFLGQPILKELIEVMSKSEGKTAEPLVVEGRKVSAEDYLKDKMNLQDLEGNPRKWASEMTADGLEQYIRDTQEGAPRDPEFDSKVLAVFNFFKGEAKNLADSLRAAKADTNGAGGSFVARMVMENKKQMVEGIRNFDQKFDGTMLGTYHSNAIDWVGEILDKSEIFLTGRTSIMDTFNEISANAGKGKLLVEEEFGKKLAQSYYSYVMSGTKLFRDNMERHNELMVELPKRVAEMKKDSENFFIQEIEIKKFGMHQFLGISSKNKPTYYQNKIYRAWLELYNDIETKAFAVDMARYAFSQSGFANNMSQFYTHIPHEILKDGEIGKDIKDAMYKIESIEQDPDFIEQFFRHRADDTKVVSTVSTANIKSIGGKALNYGFKYDVDSENSDIKVLTNEDGSAKAIYPPFLARTLNNGSTALYKKIGVLQEGDKQFPVYARTFKLGLKTSKGSMVEYKKGEKIKRSNIRDNRFSATDAKNINAFAKTVRAMDNYIPNEIVEQVQKENTTIQKQQQEIATVVETKKAQPTRATGRKEFTYDGHTIETEFELGAEQAQALRDILDFVTGKEKSAKSNVAYTLQGSAGTGKTTIIGYVEKMLKEMGGGYGSLYMAPTHAATVQLARTTIKTGNRDMPATIASSLYTDRKRKSAVFTRKTTDRMKRYARPVIFVDEASMVGLEDFNRLIEASAASDVKVVFMGDIAQIPEVKPGATSKRVSPAFEKLDRSILNIVYRQDEGTLLNILTRIRNNNKFETYKAENADESVQFLGREERLNSIENDLKTNPTGTMIISYSNKAVGQANQRARTMLGNYGAPKVGEQIIGYGGYDNKQLERGHIANSVKYTIDSVDVTPEGTVYIGASSEVMNKLRDDGIYTIPESFSSRYYQLSSEDSFDFELSYEQMERNNAEVSKHFRDLHKVLVALSQRGLQGHQIARLMAMKNEIEGRMAGFDLGGQYIYNPASDRMEKFDMARHAKIPSRMRSSLTMKKGIDFGYAITIHKSQGLTVPNVYFDVKSIDVMPGADVPVKDGGEIVTTEKNALYYVGMSRASDKVVLDDDYPYDVTLTEEDMKKDSAKSGKSQENNVSSLNENQDNIPVPDTPVDDEFGDAPVNFLDIDIIKDNWEQIKKDNNFKKDCE